MAALSQLSQWQILLIDDELDSLNLVHDMLTLNGATVYRFQSGLEGLALLDTVSPTLVIVDLSMPKPDGWEVLSTIRANPSTAALPVVAITAYASEKVVERARQVGFTALLPKPIKLNKLLSILQEVMN